MKTKNPIEQLRSYIFKNINHPHFLTMNVMLDEIEAEYMRHIKPDPVREVLKELMHETVEWCHYSGPMSGTRTQPEILDDYAERIRKAVDGPSKSHLWVSETEYNGLVDMAEECQKWRDECKKLGEQLDRLRRYDADYKGIVVKTCELDIGKKDGGLA